MSDDITKNTEVQGSAQSGPLSGVKVLDLSSVLMGPIGTRMLGDLGADVIVVEPSTGDRNRAMGPGPHDEFSGISLNLMRNKRSIMLDLKAAAGRQTFLDIAASCDVVVTNLRPRPLATLGLQYEVVREVREDIIFCRAHGYPSGSDLENAPAYDDIIQSATGLADLFQLAGHEPILMPTLIADKVCGMAIANAVLAALFHRVNSGEGQCIELAMIDVMRAFVLTEHGSGAISEPPQAEAGYPRILTPERKPQATVDGWINILPYDAEHYVSLFKAGGRDDLLDDERFQTRVGRTVNSDSLYRDIATVLVTRTTAEWLDFCTANHIPATEAVSLQQMVDNLPLAEHPVVGSYRVIPPPEQFSVTPASVRLPAPLIGEQGREILSEIGYNEETIADLVTNEVLGDR